MTAHSTDGADMVSWAIAFHTTEILRCQAVGSTRRSGFRTRTRAGQPHGVEIQRPVMNADFDWPFGAMAAHRPRRSALLDAQRCNELFKLLPSPVESHDRRGEPRRGFQNCRPGMA